MKIAAEIITCRNSAYLSNKQSCDNHSVAALDLGNFPTVSRHKALYLKGAMPTSLMCHRYPYSFFAKFSGERIRGNRRGLLTNARDTDGQQRKESAWLLNQRDSVCPELRSAKDYAKGVLRDE